MQYLRIILTGIFLLLIPSVFSQKDELRKKLQQLADSSRSDVGIAIIGIEDRDTLSVNGRRHYPMQSVFKFPLAIAVLKKIDEKRLQADQSLTVTDADVYQTWSPMLKKYKKAPFALTIREALQFMVSESDNIACDLLFTAAGGFRKVNKFIHSLGYREINIISNERMMHESFGVQFGNWCAPVEMAQLLDHVWTNRGNLLSAESHRLLWQFMTATTTGPARLRGMLPPGTVVAHKTGTGPTDEKGMNTATNDVGIVTLPNGKHFAIAVFVSNSPLDLTQREKIIAEACRMTTEYFLGKKP